MGIFCKRSHGSQYLDGWAFLLPQKGHLAKRRVGTKIQPTLFTESSALAQSASTWRYGVHFSNMHKRTIRASDKLMDNIVLRLVTQCLSWSR